VPEPGRICAVCGHTFDNHDMSAKSESVRRVYERDHISCLHDNVTMKVGCACTGFEPGAQTEQTRSEVGDAEMCAICMHQWSIHDWRGAHYGEWKRDRPGCRFEFAKTGPHYPASSSTCVCPSFWPSGNIAIILSNA